MSLDNYKYNMYDSIPKRNRNLDDIFLKKYIMYGGSEANHLSLDKDAKYLYLKYDSIPKRNRNLDDIFLKKYIMYKTKYHNLKTQIEMYGGVSREFLVNNQAKNDKVNLDRLYLNSYGDTIKYLLYRIKNLSVISQISEEIIDFLYEHDETLCINKGLYYIENIYPRLKIKIIEEIENYSKIDPTYKDTLQPLLGTLDDTDLMINLLKENTSKESISQALISDKNKYEKQVEQYTESVNKAKDDKEKEEKEEKKDKELRDKIVPVELIMKAKIEDQKKAEDELKTTTSILAAKVVVAKKASKDALKDFEDVKNKSRLANLSVSEKSKKLIEKSKELIIKSDLLAKAEEALNADILKKTEVTKLRKARQAEARTAVEAESKTLKLTKLGASKT